MMALGVHYTRGYPVIAFYGIIHSFGAQFVVSNQEWMGVALLSGPTIFF